MRASFAMSPTICTAWAARLLFPPPLRIMGASSMIGMRRAARSAEGEELTCAVGVLVVPPWWRGHEAAGCAAGEHMHRQPRRRDLAAPLGRDWPFCGSDDRDDGHASSPAIPAIQQDRLGNRTCRRRAWRVPSRGTQNRIGPAPVVGWRGEPVRSDAAAVHPGSRRGADFRMVGGLDARGRCGSGDLSDGRRRQRWRRSDATARCASPREDRYFRPPGSPRGLECRMGGGDVPRSPRRTCGGSSAVPGGAGRQP